MKVFKVLNSREIILVPLEVKEFNVLNSREIIPVDPSPKCHPTASTLIAAFPKSQVGTGHPKAWSCPFFPGSSWIGGCWSSLDPGGGAAGAEGVGKDLGKIRERSGKDLGKILCPCGRLFVMLGIIPWRPDPEGI